MQVCSNEGKHIFPRGNTNEMVKMHEENNKNRWANINQSWYKASIDDGNSSFTNKDYSTIKTLFFFSQSTLHRHLCLKLISSEINIFLTTSLFSNQILNDNRAYTLNK